MPEESVRLEFLGQVYHLKSDDPEVDLKEIVDYVQTKAREQQRLYGAFPPHKLVVLTVMNIGKDYVKLRNRLKVLEKALAEKTCELVSKIDSAIDFVDK